MIQRPRAGRELLAGRSAQLRSARAARARVAVVSAATVLLDPDALGDEPPAGDVLAAEGEPLEAAPPVVALPALGAAAPDEPWPPLGIVMPGMLEWSMACCAETPADNPASAAKMLKETKRDVCRFIWISSLDNRRSAGCLGYRRAM